MSAAGSDYPGDQCRRWIRRAIVFALYALGGLGCTVGCITAAMAVMVVIFGFASLGEGILRAFGAVEALAQVFASIFILLFSLAAGILELLWLISTGQVVQFVQRLAQMLSQP
jgi:hypothetical protein